MILLSKGQGATDEATLFTASVHHRLPLDALHPVSATEAYARNRLSGRER